MSEQSKLEADERLLLEQEYNRLNISAHDFTDAHAYLELYDPSSSIVLQEAIASAAVVAYARPFKWSNQGKEQLSTAKATLDLPSLFDTKQRAMHETIIKLRDQGVAHSDYDLKPTRRLRGPEGGAMSWSKPFSPLQGLDVPIFKAMAWLLNAHCVSLTIQIAGQLNELGVVAEKQIGPLGPLENCNISLRIPLSAFRTKK